ncbi:MAG: hypothetical protein IKO36_09320 [Bacteroidaceae bacterium]|nr:hypothetical protein [Bacteroidaceae bacterium]
MKKKIFALLVAALSVCTVSAQVSFMGIPVDGTKYDVEKALERKGFNYCDEGMEGKIDGKPVFVAVFVNDAGKVYRIAVANMSPIRNQNVAKERYNALADMFANDNRYTVCQSTRIPQTTDIYKTLALRGNVCRSVFSYNSSTTQMVGVFLLYDGTHGTKAYNSDGWYVSVRFDNLDNQPK